MLVCGLLSRIAEFRDGRYLPSFTPNTYHFVLPLGADVLSINILEKLISCYSHCLSLVQYLYVKWLFSSEVFRGEDSVGASMQA
jgi:hypothetical protein